MRYSVGYIRLSLELYTSAHLACLAIFTSNSDTLYYVLSTAIDS